MGLSNAGVGTLSAFRNVSGGVMNIPAGFVADRYRSQGAAILGISIIVVGISLGALGLVHSLPLAVLAATIFSIGITFWHPTAISALSRRFAHKRGFMISLHGTGGSIGEVLGPLVVGGLLLFMGWRFVLNTVGGPGILAGVVIWLLLRKAMSSGPEQTPAPNYLQSLTALLANRRLLSLLILVVGYSASQSSIVTFLPIFLQDEVGYSASVMTLFIAASQTVGIISQPIMGMLSDRYGRKKVLLPSLLAIGVIAFGITLAEPGVPMFLTIAAMGAFNYPLMSILVAAVGDIAVENVQATAVSLVFAVAITMGGISPLISGLLADAFSVKTVFLYAAAMAAATGLFLALQRWPARVP